ncbi:hypothetical protein BV917_15100 [Leptospira santarosai serovar Guaricura]|uniref:hypothetical protein n=1 Tax=Leptospira santarosai TaxID=28183 RepID=UPI000969C6D6|nr:hypothetical protein [Leptospira santarosai]OLY59328.1 hypothetical protein BV917_15100 [Leptospira santarosai serovar Guaricura]
MRVNLPLEVRQNESTVIRLRGLKNIFSPVAQILFQIKESSASSKILLSIEPLPSDEGADWEHEEIVIKIPPAMTRGLIPKVYEWDLLVNRQGEFTYPYWGIFTLTGTISRNNETVDPVVINDLETRLAGTTMGRGSWMIGVFSNYWLGKLGGVGNLVLEKCLEWLDQNKLEILNPFTGSKLLKSGTFAIEVLESGIGIDSLDNVTGARSISLLLAPSLDSHATRRDWVIALVDAAIVQVKADIVHGAPGVLDTLQEISNALNNDPNFATTLLNQLASKADLVSGKIPLSQLPVLSSPDWTVIQNKPSVFPPTLHDHDSRYYTKSESDSALLQKRNTSTPIPAVEVVEDTTHRFVTDTERAAWNAVSGGGFSIPLGGILEDGLDQLPSSNFKETNGQAISRTTFSTFWNLVRRNVTGIVASTDRINSAAHGCAEGQLVKFSFTGGGIAASTDYYVRNPTTNDFQISLGPTGGVINLTASLTGDMITNVEYGFGDGLTTFTIPDRRGIFPRGAGVHGSRAKMSGGNYDGGPVGAAGQDRIPSHRHQQYAGDIAGGTYGQGGRYADSGGSNSATILYTGSAVSDGTGAPRNGNETAPAWTSVRYKIRVL